MAKSIQIGFLLLLLAIDWAFDTDQGMNCLNGPMSSQLSLGHNQPTDTGSSDYADHAPVFALLHLPLDLACISLTINLSYADLSPRFHSLVDIGYLFMCIRQ